MAYIHETIADYQALKTLGVDADVLERAVSICPEWGSVVGYDSNGGDADAAAVRDYYADVARRRASAPQP